MARPSYYLGGAWQLMLSGVSAAANGERPVDVAGVFLERHQDLAGRS
jgi:hypothetical protein